MGFIRLRLPNEVESAQHFIPALRDAALIRELHVYGSLKKVNDKGEFSKPQHNGFGKSLVMTAENIAWYNGYKKVAIISGVGVRKYYQRMGYVLKNTYMVKEITLLKVLYNLFFIFIAYMKRMISRN